MKPIPTRWATRAPSCCMQTARSRAGTIRAPTVAPQAFRPLLLLWDRRRAGRSHRGNLDDDLAVFRPRVVRRFRRLGEERPCRIGAHLTFIPRFARAEIK